MQADKALATALCLVALVGLTPAQIVSPPEIRDLQMRELQQKYLRELKSVAETIKAHRFPYRFYFSRTMDLNQQRQERSDQRSVRFEKFRTQTALEITGNYFASYPGERIKKEERAERTLEDVMLPMLDAAIPLFAGEEKLQAFALEVSHHVRRKVLGVDTENAENVTFILPRDAARRVMLATSPGERDAALRQGMLYVNGQALAGWSVAAAPQVTTSAAPSDGHFAGQPAGRGAASAPSSASGELARVLAAARSSGGVIGSLPVLNDAAVPAASPDPAIARTTDIKPETLRQKQSDYQDTLDKLAHELDKEAHFVSYAPPTFINFHKGIYLQLSIITTLQQRTAGSQYLAAALAFDEHVAHLIRPVLARFQQRAEFDGVDFSTIVRSGRATADAASVAVEFIFSLPMLRAYEQYDCTGQQLINQGFVLINGERVSLDLQNAEAGAPPH